MSCRVTAASPSGLLNHEAASPSVNAQMRRRRLHAHNELIGATEDSLSDALAALNRWSAAAAACGRSEAILQAAYPQNSLVVAHQRQKHVALLRRAGDHVAAAASDADVSPVMTLHFGDEYDIADS